MAATFTSTVFSSFSWLKIRLQGTVKDIRWFKRLLEKHPEIRVLQMSEIFSNKGTNRYFRSYIEAEKKEKEER